jgi:hypothetical protein
MFYNLNDEILISKLPKNLLKNDGSLFIDFNKSDTETLSDYGYYSVRNDNNEMPIDCEKEDISKRLIVLHKPYVDIVRTWIKKPTEPSDVL